MSNSTRVTTNQEGVHENLENIVKGHMQHDFLKPVASHTKAAFDELDHKVRQISPDSIMLDSGCGAGDSTIHLAHFFPESLIIGIDKSVVRLQKLKTKDIPENVLFARADQFDLWRLVADANWPVKYHFIFYPNPWPKKAHIKRRIYGHPVFVELPKITKQIQVRSNWLIYLKEFSRAWMVLMGEQCRIDTIDIREPISLFEKKFNESGHQLYRLSTVEELSWI